ncbi:MAG TPA: hypothetical protein PLV42_05305 [bacterium]|nr:hypothetical protein [bacterium]
MKKTRLRWSVGHAKAGAFMRGMPIPMLDLNLVSLNQLMNAAK